MIMQLRSDYLRRRDTLAVTPIDFLAPLIKNLQDIVRG